MKRNNDNMSAADWAALRRLKEQRKAKAFCEETLMVLLQNPRLAGAVKKLAIQSPYLNGEKGKLVRDLEKITQVLKRLECPKERERYLKGALGPKRKTCLKNFRQNNNN